MEGWERLVLSLMRTVVGSLVWLGGGLGSVVDCSVWCLCQGGLSVCLCVGVAVAVCLPHSAGRRNAGRPA